MSPVGKKESWELEKKKKQPYFTSIQTFDFLDRAGKTKTRKLRTASKKKRKMAQKHSGKSLANTLPNNIKKPKYIKSALQPFAPVQPEFAAS